MSGDQAIFRPLSADDPEPETTEIESFCLNCEKNGITRLLLTKIPFYKEVVLMSFHCEHCGYRNNEIQSGGKIEEKGVRITLKVNSLEDLNRQVYKSDFTSVKIPELEFEIPSQSQKGEVTTVEGVIDRSVEGLEQDQPARREEDPEAAAQIDAFLNKLKDLKTVASPFTFIVEDISGNSFISNPNAPLQDPSCTTAYFVRQKKQDHILGIYDREEVSDAAPGVMKQFDPDSFKYEDLEGEVLIFQTNCSNCNAPCETTMKMTSIPYFKDVVIMGTHCEACGHRTNEVKSGGGIEPKGVRIEVAVATPEDYARDVLKSETCSLEVPELELSVGPSAVSGRFTTVEGLLKAMKDQLSENSALFTDSLDSGSEGRMSLFLKKFSDLVDNMKPVTLVLDDPAGNSYVLSLTDPAPDPALKITRYERSFEQNEDLGLNDMKTENYEES